ncbi:tetratricopeptide repeat protein [Moorellaceae bacterium AZ2]
MWHKENTGLPELDVLGVEDLTGDGRPEIIIGWIIGASAGNQLEVLSYTKPEKDGDPSYAALWQTGYHRLEVGDFDGDNRREIALWAKDTGPAMAVEVYRWAPALDFPAGFYEAADVYPTYFLLAQAYYSSGLAWEGLQQYDRAREAYARAVELRSDWILPARALQRLKARPDVDKVTALKPKEREGASRG